jgi:uncharacterized membrane protein YhaH (DUF805 family)
VLIVGVGVLVGLWISRRIVLPALQRVGVAAGSSAIAGIAVLLAVLMSNGSVGVERLRDLGPAPLLSAALVFVLLCVGSVPVVLAFGRRPLREFEIIEPSVVSTAVVSVTPDSEVTSTPAVEQTEQSAMIASSVLDQSNTQIIPLPATSETRHE